MTQQHQLHVIYHYVSNNYMFLTIILLYISNNINKNYYITIVYVSIKFSSDKIASPALNCCCIGSAFE
jgi:hypothetical protein